MLGRSLLSFTLLTSLLSALPAQAQVPFPRDLVPTRTALAHAGLERSWMVTVPLTGDERVMLVSMNNDMVFASTNKGNFHAYEAETGRLLWSANIGPQTARARPASGNSFAVFVTNLNMLYALDRRTGRPIWQFDLQKLPTSSTSCDEDHVYVGLNDGKIYGYTLRVKDTKGNSVVLAQPAELWNWQTNGNVETRPLPGEKLTAFGSDDGKVYVSLTDERTMLYRIATGGKIGAGLGTHGDRLLLIPSADKNLYGVDFLTARIRWVYSSGAPISQEPMVADDDIFVINDAGQLSSMDPEIGSPRWSIPTQGGKLLSVGNKRVYLETEFGDLFIVDRASGQTVAPPAATLYRYGLNLREYALGVTNRLNDRLYFATTSGLIICVHEIGQTKPRLLRDPNAKPFGFIPREGIIKELMTPPPSLSPGAEPEPAAADKPADAVKPEGDKPEPEPEKPEGDKPAPAEPK